MPNIDQQIKETAQFWSKFFKEKQTSGLGKAFEASSGKLQAKIRFGCLLEDTMIRMQQEAASVADRFEAILIEILREITRSYPNRQTRTYLDYEDCELLSYSQSTYSVDLVHDYRPSNVLSEALHRTSLETNVNLVKSSTFLFPSKINNRLPIYDWLENSLQDEPLLDYKTSSEEPKNVTRAVAYCEDLRKIRDEARHRTLPSLTPTAPTMQEKLLSSAKSGAVHGVLRGTTQLLGNILRKNNISENSAHKVSQALYYGGIFTMSFTLQSQDIMDVSSCLNAIYRSALETGKIIIINAVLDLSTKFLDNLSHVASIKGWRWTSNILGKCSPLVKHSVFAINAVEQGVATTAVAIGSGVATQLIVEKVGNRLVQ